MQSEYAVTQARIQRRRELVWDELEKAVRLYDGTLLDAGAPSPRVRFKLDGLDVYAQLDSQWQHPEAQGIVRQIVDRNGRILAQSIHESWLGLYRRAEHSVRVDA